MSKNTLYILHPSIKFLPDAFVWVEEVKSILAKEESWIDWGFESFPYDDKNSFHVQSIFIRVKNKPGPSKQLQVGLWKIIQKAYPGAHIFKPLAGPLNPDQWSGLYERTFQVRRI